MISTLRLREGTPYLRKGRRPISVHFDFACDYGENCDLQGATNGIPIMRRLKKHHEYNDRIIK
jgi:hypothetical protein